MNTKRDWLLMAAGAFYGMAGVAMAEGGWIGLAVFFAVGVYCRVKAGAEPEGIKA